MSAKPLIPTSVTVGWFWEPEANHGQGGWVANVTHPDPNACRRKCCNRLAVRHFYVTYTSDRIVKQITSERDQLKKKLEKVWLRLFRLLPKIDRALDGD